MGIIGRLSGIGGILGTAALIFMVTSTLYDVIVRYVFAAPTYWVLEVNTFLLALLCTIPAADVLRTNSHIRVVFGIDKASPRPRIFLTRLRALIGILFSGVMTREGWLMAWQAWQYGDRMSTTLGTPMVIPYLFMPIGFGLLGLQYCILFAFPSDEAESDAPKH
jgi:TRAP-type C4-dicarboxylate transport system permease small subunit